MPFLNEVLVANGTTSLGRIVWAKAVLDIITNDHVLTMTVNAGGTGYVVGESFDIVGGTALSGFVARGVVTAEAAGVVTGVKILSAGAYSVAPGLTGALTTNASAAGNDDLTVDITMQTARWTLDTDDYVDDATDFEWIATSVKATNPATIGLRTVTSAGNDAVRLMVASGYDNLAQWTAQPDTSPTDVIYVNVPSQNPELFISTTERRVNLVARDGNNVQYGGLGLFLPLTDDAATYPFPGLVHGQTRGVRAMSNQWNGDGNGNGNAGILHPNGYTTIAHASRYRDNLSASWKQFANQAASVAVDATIYPQAGFDSDYSMSFAPTLSGFGTNPFRDSAFEPSGAMTDQSGNGSAGGWFQNPGGSAQGVQGVSNLGIGNQMSFVVTAHIIQVEVGDTQAIGVIDGFEAVHGVGLTAFEELQSHAEASRYIVFPDTNTSVVEDWCAMEII